MDGVTTGGGGVHDLSGYVCCHNLAWQDVEQQDRRQLILVLRLYEVFHRARWKCGKGIVGRGEYGERASALQRIDQPGCGHGSDQRGKRPGGDGRVYDVMDGIGHFRFLRMAMPWAKERPVSAVRDDGCGRV